MNRPRPFVFVIAGGSAGSFSKYGQGLQKQKLLIFNSAHYKENVSSEMNQYLLLYNFDGTCVLINQKVCFL